MFENILIGIDDHHGGHDAIALGQELSTPGSHFTLAHVCAERRLRGRASAAERERAGTLLAEAQSETGTDGEIVLVEHAHVGAGLHELANRIDADLLVVGSSRHGPVGRVLIGDDARAALRRAGCSVAVASHGYAKSEDRFTRIGLGYDDTAESDSALVAAREIAERHGARINALWVTTNQDVQARAPIPADWPEAIERLLQEHAWRLEQLGGLAVDSVYGGSREELAALTQQVDLLVVGSHRHGHAHGGIPVYLADHASCPLLVTSASRVPAKPVAIGGTRELVP